VVGVGNKGLSDQSVALSDAVDDSAAVDQIYSSHVDPIADDGTDSALLQHRPGGRVGEGGGRFTAWACPRPQGRVPSAAASAHTRLEVHRSSGRVGFHRCASSGSRTSDRGVPSGRDAPSTASSLTRTNCAHCDTTVPWARVVARSFSTVGVRGCTGGFSSPSRRTRPGGNGPGPSDEGAERAAALSAAARAVATGLVGGRPRPGSRLGVAFGGHDADALAKLATRASIGVARAARSARTAPAAAVGGPLRRCRYGMALSLAVGAATRATAAPVSKKSANGFCTSDKSANRCRISTCSSSKGRRADHQQRRAS